ncbi:hypothetical protein RQP46_001364 [Phenoliferia psychrophenolica]
MTSLSPPFPPSLDALRLKLVQLIDALTQLQSHLRYLADSTAQPSTRNPGILPYPDLLARYNLLLSHVVSMGTLLSSVNDGREVKKGEEGIDRKKDVWDSAVVVPGEQVEEAKDWIVGVLLRTKQTPAVEAHLASLSSSLPPHFFANPTTQEQSRVAYEARTTAALAKIQLLKEGLDDDEWDWKGRVDVDEDEEEDESGEEGDEEDGAGDDGEGDVSMVAVG